MLKYYIQPFLQGLAFVIGIYIQKFIRKSLYPKSQYPNHDKQFKLKWRVGMMMLLTFIIMTYNYKTKCQPYGISAGECFYLVRHNQPIGTFLWLMLSILTPFIANMLLFSYHIYQKIEIKNDFTFQKLKDLKAIFWVLISIICLLGTNSLIIIVQSIILPCFIRESINRIFVSHFLDSSFSSFDMEENDKQKRLPNTTNYWSKFVYICIWTLQFLLSYSLSLCYLFYCFTLYVQLFWTAIFQQEKYKIPYGSYDYVCISCYFFFQQLIVFKQFIVIFFISLLILKQWNL